MNFRPRVLCVKQLAVVARLIVAAALVLALLSGIAPFNATSSSAAQLCTMSCCVGKPTHPSGSCGMSFSGTAQLPHGVDASCSGMDMSLGHDDGMMQMPDDATPPRDKDIASSDHSNIPAYHAAQTSSWQLSSSEASSSQTSPLQFASAGSQILTAPCSPECGAGISSFTQVRPSREQAALADADKPRPPPIVSLKDRFRTLLSFSTERRRQCAPRAPPFA